MQTKNQRETRDKEIGEEQTAAAVVVEVWRSFIMQNKTTMKVIYGGSTIDPVCGLTKKEAKRFSADA